MNEVRYFGFTDKNGKPVDENNVLFDGSEYYRIGYNNPTEELYLLNCKGYKHGITKEYISTLENVGLFQDMEYLFQCD